MKLGITTVETAAYYRALGEQKGLDMDKYRKQVQNEIKSQSTSKTGEC